MKNGHGGKRAGSGRKKGSQWPSTLEKVLAREQTRQYITQVIPVMLRHQVANACGIGHLYTRDKAGKFTKIEDPERVDTLLRDGEEGRDYWIFTKDPSVQAFTALMDRALDRPADHLELTGSDGGPLVVQWLA